LAQHSNTICILIKSPYRGFWGGTIQAYNQAKEISKFGVNVIIVTTSVNNNRIIKIAKNKEGSIEVHNLESSFFKIKILRFIIVFIYLLTIKDRFDILQIVNDHYCIISAIITKFFKKKSIMIITSYYGYIVKAGIIGKIKLLAISKLDVIVTKSYAMFRLYKEKFKSHPYIVLLPNGVDTKKFKPISNLSKNKLKLNLGFKEDEIIILFVGNILKEKGVDVLIDLFINKQFSIKNYRLLLVGNKNIDLKFTKKIEKQIKSANLSKKLLLIGETNNVECYYQIADFFLLPSRREGMPNVVLEAMASKLCCIVSNLEYAKDIIKNGTGFKIDINDKDRFWRTINRVAVDDNLRDEIGKNSKRAIEKNYKIECIAKKYAELYSKL
jgi:glycosyltransferase involved in cell wall biosynthesis